MGERVQYRFLGIPVYEKRIADLKGVERRSAVDNFPISDMKNPADWLFGTFGYPSSSNVLVTEDQALTLSAVWSCIGILAETLAMQSLNVYRLDDKGNRQLAVDDPLYFLLHSRPNPLMTSLKIINSLANPQLFHIFQVVRSILSIFSSKVSK